MIFFSSAGYIVNKTHLSLNLRHMRLKKLHLTRLGVKMTPKVYFHE